MRRVFRGDGDILGIEPALRVCEAVGIDPIADREAANGTASIDHGAGTVAPEHQREGRFSLRPPAATHVRIPWPDARGMDRDQDLIRIECGDRHLMDGENLRTAEAV